MSRLATATQNRDMAISNVRRFAPRMIGPKGQTGAAFRVGVLPGEGLARLVIEEMDVRDGAGCGSPTQFPGASLVKLREMSSAGVALTLVACGRHGGPTTQNGKQDVLGLRKTL